MGRRKLRAVIKDRKIKQSHEADVSAKCKLAINFVISRFEMYRALPEQVCLNLILMPIRPGDRL